jgi:hypothetical protein
LRAVADRTGLALPLYLPVVGVQRADHGTWLVAGRAAGRGMDADLPALAGAPALPQRDRGHAGRPGRRAAYYPMVSHRGGYPDGS